MSTNASASDPFARALSRGGDGRGSKAWADVLASVPLFEGLSQRHLRKIAGQATVKRFAPLTAIVREGASGDAFYVILDGTASVRGPASVRSRSRPATSSARWRCWTAPPAPPRSRHPARC